MIGKMSKPPSSMESPSFFKVMIGDFRTTVRIPPQFKKKHLGENLGERAVLRSPGGRQWRIKMGVEDGELFFRDGWESFVSDHAISLGDFLVFFYDGNVGFNVKVYGTTGCEKVECCPPEVKIEKGSEDSDDEKPIVRLRVNQQVNRKRKATSVAINNNEKRNRVKKSKLCYKVLRGANPTENHNALKAACSFKTPHPHFVTTCRNSRTTYMTIPTELAKKYNLDEKNLIVLRDPRGTSWSVRLSSWQDGRRCLSSGWSHLYKKNRLKEGDVCVLEFVQGGAAINVHIFRAEEYNAKKIPKSRERLLTEDNKGTVLNASKCFESSHPKNVTSERLLTEDDKKRVLNAAKSFESSHPKFVTVWRSTRLYHVPIPKKVVVEVGLRGNQRTTLFGPSGKSWPVNITFRSYGQVELGIGWSHFSRGNKLDLGDVCVFEFLGGADAIKVHIFRAGETNSSAASDTLVLETR